MISLRIRDNELCPCGSGKTYKCCCKGKKAQFKESKKPPEVQIMDRMRSSMPKCCLHPVKEECRGKIKEAHALQNNKIISLLAGDSRHVYMLNSKKRPLLVPMSDEEIIPIVEVSKVSANDATTETCFCDYHDNVVFAAIEKGAPNFEPDNQEMKFIYAYKSFIFEFYKQKTAYEMFQKLFKENPSIATDKQVVGIYRMLQIKMDEFNPIKEFYDEKIKAKKSDGLYTCAVKIPEQINFANYAFIAPNYDLDGRKIKHTKKGIMHRVSITIFPEIEHSWIILSCLESEKKIYEPLFRQMKDYPMKKIKFYINMVLPLYSENMVLSPLIWEAWDDDMKCAYTYYANLNGKNALVMDKAIGFALKNASRDKTGKVYDIPPKLNLFV